SEDSPGRKVRLDTKKATESLSLIGDPVKIAEKALSLADLEMARAIRLVTYERGLDPSGFALYAFGGAGPQHAARVASLLGITRVVIPVNPAAFSAVGLIQADWKYEEASAFPTDLEKDYQMLISKLAKKNNAHTISLSADCRYAGQGTDLPVPVTGYQCNR
ncbi:Hydantoinase/oxoprolinase, partial [mine drainage metagenome]